MDRHPENLSARKADMLRQFREQEADHRRELQRVKAAMKSEMAEVARSLMDVPGIDAEAFAAEMAEMQALLEYESSGIAVERGAAGGRTNIRQRDEQV